MSERDEPAAELWKHHYEDFTMAHDGTEKSYCQCGAAVYPMKSLVQHQAEVALAHRKPRTVTTAAELDALPVGSVVRSDAGTIACKCEATRGVVFGDDRSFPWLKLATPATVLHEPEGER
ncbi:hypothetical protein SPF06_00960 [Sinomonas sp. JGH33]|uniref:Uncharacterized protein n=1 Tax=Sinomonas terricola TaxID=3110330 RepID=A0ABU5T0V7_9MICC|nr:hypothetical protein [Sinomonas sp. JGH33]MEA5453280.1 hypothetical protein [Sinomonas sp. JGH33]